MAFVSPCLRFEAQVLALISDSSLPVSWALAHELVMAAAFVVDTLGDLRRRGW